MARCTRSTRKGKEDIPIRFVHHHTGDHRRCANVPANTSQSQNVTKFDQYFEITLVRDCQNSKELDTTVSLMHVNFNGLFFLFAHLAFDR